MSSCDTSNAEGLIVGSVCQHLDIRVITISGSLGNGPGRSPFTRASCNLNILFVKSLLFVFEYGFMHVRTSEKETPKLYISTFGS